LSPFKQVQLVGKHFGLDAKLLGLGGEGPAGLGQQDELRIGERLPQGETGSLEGLLETVYFVLERLGQLGQALSLHPPTILIICAHQTRPLLHDKG
jgi:hypothetical protein